MNAYLDESGRALKPLLADDEPTGRGPLVGRDPRPLVSTMGGADPAGSRSAHERPRPPAHGETTGATSGASPHWGLCTHVNPKRCRGMLTSPRWTGVLRHTRSRGPWSRRCL